MSQSTLFRQSSWKRIFVLTVHRVRNPIGSNIFADNFKTEHFGGEITQLYKSVKLKKNSSATVSQFIPRTLTTVPLYYQCSGRFCVWLIICCSIVSQPSLYLRVLTGFNSFQKVLRIYIPFSEIETTTCHHSLRFLINHQKALQYNNLYLTWSNVLS